LGQKEKILIADSQFLTTESLVKLIEAEERYFVCGVAGTRSALMEMMQANKPDLVITDINLIDYDGTDDVISLTKENGEVSLLILTNQLTNAEVQRLLFSGINNIALKTDKKDDLLYSIEMALKHRRHFSDDILEMILEMNNGRNVPAESHEMLSPGLDSAKLTSSEHDIVKLIAEGFTTKQIASRKNISFHTVMTHRKNIFRKLNINSVSDLTRYAIRKGLIDNIEYNI
jgi:DNA-binding NarL/FixJ family response regulator